MKQKSIKYITIVIGVLYMMGMYFLYPQWGNAYLMISIILLIPIGWLFNLIWSFGFLSMVFFNLFIASIVFNFDIQLLLSHNVLIGLILLTIILSGLYLLKSKSAHLNTTESFLKNAKIRLDTMISNTSDVIGILNPLGVIVFKTSNIEKYFGWKPDDLIGKFGWEAIHPDDKERAVHDFQSLLGHKDKVISVEYLYQCKNGSFKNIILFAKNLIHHPHVNGILINYSDITDRKKSSQALVESEYKYRTLFENSIDVVCRLDMQGNIIDLNEAATELFGYIKEKILTINVMNFLHPEDKEKSNVYFKKLATEGAYSMF
jgi:PAS domain S-box-containing protein